MLKVNEKGLNGRFAYTYAGTEMGWVSGILTERSSNQRTETYAGVGTVGQMEEFQGEHQYATLSEDQLTVPNKRYVNGIEIDQFDWLENKTGQVGEQVDSLAVDARDFQRQLVVDVATNNTLTGFDGKALYATDHLTRKSGAQSNDISGLANKATAAGWRTAFFTMIKNIVRLKSDQGRFMNRSARSFLFVVRPEDAELAFAAVENQLGANGETNTLREQRRYNVEVEVEPDLTTADQFLTFVQDTPDKAIVLQERKGVETHTHGPGSVVWNKKKVAEFGIDWNGYAKPWKWWTTMRGTFA